MLSTLLLVLVFGAGSGCGGSGLVLVVDLGAAGFSMTVGSGLITGLGATGLSLTAGAGLIVFKGVGLGVAVEILADGVGCAVGRTACCGGAENPAMTILKKNAIARPPTFHPSP
jgi:hypothetical protein